MSWLNLIMMRPDYTSLLSSVPIKGFKPAEELFDRSVKLFTVIFIK